MQQQLTEKEQLPAKIENIAKNISEINKNIKTIKDNPNRVINKYLTISDIKIEKGNLLIDNNIGNNTNLSHNNYTTRIEEVKELEVNIEIPPKSN